MGPPGSGPPSAEYFESGILESPEELEAVVDKINTIGFVGSMGGPGSRRDHGHPLKTASEEGSINFATHSVVLAIFPQRMQNPTIIDVQPVGGELQVSCGARGPDRGSMPSGNGVQLVSFAAAVMPRAPGGKPWKTKFLFGQKVPDESDGE